MNFPPAATVPCRCGPLVDNRISSSFRTSSRRVSVRVVAAAPAASQGAGSATVLSIVPFAIQNGIQFAKIKPFTSGTSGERGVVATFPIGPNECLCSVPAAAALRLTPGSQPVLGVPLQVWKGLPWYGQLALLLLAEVHPAGPSKSKYAPYIAVLPAEVDVPALWPDSAVQQLLCKYFIQQVQEQQQEWQLLHQQLKPYLTAAGITNSQQQLHWALAVVRSRAFAAPYTAAPLATAPKLLAAAQIAAGAAWLAQGVAAAAVVEVAGVAAAAATAFMLLQQSQQQQQHALCPLLDMFNHDGRVQSECELDIWSAAFRVVASQPWRAGEQVFINYSSNSSNDALLQLYGFVERGNSHERFLVQSIPAALAAAGLCDVESNVHQQLSQVAFTRQGLPAPAAAVVEQLASGRQLPTNNTTSTLFYVLSDEARAVCLEAVSREMQQLGVDAKADLQLLQAFKQLPSKRAEFAALQQQVQQLSEACKKQEQEQQEQQEQLQQEKPLQLLAGASAAERQGQGAAVVAIAAEGQQESPGPEPEQLQQQLAEAQMQLEQLALLVRRWEADTATVKHMAVQYRMEKHQLLSDIMGLLQ